MNLLNMNPAKKPISSIILILFTPILPPYLIRTPTLLRLRNTVLYIYINFLWINIAPVPDTYTTISATIYGNDKKVNNSNCNNKNTVINNSMNNTHRTPKCFLCS